MLIAITQRSINISKNKEIRDSLDRRLIKYILMANLKPFIVPNVFNKKNEKTIRNLLNKISVKGVILTGGDDFGNDISRDITENILIRWASQKRLPILGICRGMQLICKNYGSQLKKVKNHVGTRHRIISYNKNFKFNNWVNSYHNYSIKECPKLFKVLATASDGCIEAVISTRLNLFGIMWHPEREKKINKYDLKFLIKIFKNNW